MTVSERNMQMDWKATVAILGARKHYAVPAVLAAHGYLERFYTDWYTFKSGWAGQIRSLLHYLPIKTFRRISTRSNTSLPDQLVKAFPFLGLSYALSLRMNGGEAVRERVYVRYGRKFGEAVGDSGFGGSDLVYGMNTASVELFQNAVQFNVKCVLEQCSAPYSIYDQLLLEEYSLWPNWALDETPHRNLHLSDREKQEWNLSQLIVCGSQFVLDGLELQGVPREKCIMIPSAVDLNNHPNKVNETRHIHSKLRVLFLGSISVMKGIQYVYKALRQLENSSIETRAAGGIMVNRQALTKMEEHIQFLGHVPRADVRNLLRWADVLVLPSISEGSALVTYEALASGVPVITTPNSGSPVQDGVTGFIVPNRNAEAIAERLEQLAQNPELRREMSINARKYAEEHLSWDAYATRLIAALESVLD